MTKRFEGARWRIVYGSYSSGVEKFAVDELQRAVQKRVPYVVETVEAGAQQYDSHVISVGTGEGNCLIRQLADRGAIALPSHPQGYTISTDSAPWDKALRIAAIAGSDPAGVLNGVEDFNDRVLARLGGDNANSIRAALDKMPDMSISEYPRVATRGIWTWGYVIYDYKRFFDNMARLRMNSITIWNDCPPINCSQVIEYAHSRGISVILAFHWGWGTNLDLAKKEDRLAIKDDVLKRFRRDYRHLEMDGIYFQTLTEHGDVETGGRTTASWACELANDVSAALLVENPALLIQFGLHATSVGDRYEDLAPLDRRVTVVWEDLGAIPFSYDPTAELVAEAHGQYRCVPRTSDDTLLYAKRLASIRPRGGFAMVAKGWTSLNWREEFENHGPFILGERDGDFMRMRLAQRQARWDYVNPLWFGNSPLAARFYRDMLDEGGELAVWGLVEDGLFEEAIQPSVALFAQTLWNPRRPDDEILQAAIRSGSAT